MADVNKLKVGEMVLVKRVYSGVNSNPIVCKFDKVLTNSLTNSLFAMVIDLNKTFHQKRICHSCEIYKLTTLCA